MTLIPANVVLLPPDHVEPPLWLPLLAGLALALVLVVMALPVLGHGVVTLSRALYLFAFALWVLPLTLLQRALVRRSWTFWRLALALVVATYAMALSARVLNLGLQSAITGQSLRAVDWPLALRGLEGAWLALLAYCALHAVVASYTALRTEQVRHLQAQAMVRDAELRALRYQLQPHFLFNTLNAISALVADGRAHEAQRMLARLGDFLRATLEGTPSHEVSLADEIAMTQAYLEIEKTRMGDRLEVKWELGLGLLQAQVPYLLLQPLIENAIRHGIAPRTAPGRLDIRISDDAGQLRVRVSNDLAGPGHEAAPRENAVGLRNIAERLHRLHPGRQAMRAGLGADGRFHVDLTFPLRVCAQETK